MRSIPRSNDPPAHAPTGEALPANSFGLRDALLMGWLGALIATVGHALYVVARVFIQHKFSWTSRDILWTGPLSYGMYIIPATLVACTIVRNRTPETRAHVALTTSGALAGFGALLLVRVVHPLALLALSVGVAHVIAGWVVRRSRGSRTIVDRAAVALTILFAVGAGVIRIVPLVRETLALREAVVASDQRPNVLLVILDTVRAASMGLYGYRVANTPELEHLARQGTTFTWAIAPSSWSLPSHTSILTGLDAKAANVGWKRTLANSAHTLGEQLAQEGFVEAGFVANQIYTTWETNIDQGFHRWDDIVPNPVEIFWTSTLSQTALVRDLLQADSSVSRWATLRRFNLRLTSESRHVRRNATSVIDRALAWQGRVGNRRFFALINLFDAHDPYDPPEPWRTKFVASPNGQDRYDASIAYMDHELGRLLDTLRARGVLDHTVVIVTSDHGELFGEHSLHGHGQFLYLNSIHVPLVVRFPPRVPVGRVVDSPVALQRLAATIIDLVGDPRGDIPGRSLASAWSTSPEAVDSVATAWVERFPWRDDFPASKGPVVSVLDSTWHWLLNADGREELYRYRDDALETHDFGTADETVKTRRALRELAAQQGLTSDSRR